LRWGYMSMVLFFFIFFRSDAVILRPSMEKVTRTGTPNVMNL
jgi:hypothetical protein